MHNVQFLTNSWACLLFSSQTIAASILDYMLLFEFVVVAAGTHSCSRASKSSESKAMYVIWFVELSRPTMIVDAQLYTEVSKAYCAW